MTSRIDVEAIVERIRPRARRSPLPGHERIHGWGIMAHPFDSGHVLALRVASQNDFAPYTSVWHRSPEGAWSIYVDGPRLDIACPRYWGAATEHAHLTDVSVEWIGPAELAVDVADPDLRWIASMDAGLVVRGANGLTSRLPESVLRSGPVIRLTELVADRLFGLGDVTLSTPVPNGQDATVLTRRLFPIMDGSATLDGEDLGNSTTLAETPTFGEARLPARPVFVVGGAYATILDDDEYERTIEEVHRGQRPGGDTI